MQNVSAIRTQLMNELTARGITGGQGMPQITGARLATIVEGVEKKLVSMGYTNPAHVPKAMVAYVASIAKTAKGTSVLVTRIVNNYTDNGRLPRDNDSTPEDNEAPELKPSSGDDNGEHPEGDSDSLQDGNSDNSDGESDEQSGNSSESEGESEGESDSGEGDSDGDADGESDADSEGEDGDSEGDSEDNSDEEQSEEESEGEQSEEDGDGESQVPEQVPEQVPQDSDDGYIKPAMYDVVKLLLAKNKNVMLVGPRGTGKTEMVFRICKELQMNLHMITSPQDESQVEGFVNAVGDYVPTAVTDALTEEKPLVMFEEFDRSRPEALICMNSLLANRKMNVPKWGLMDVPEECRFVATANTVGRGRSSEYGTAQKLDASTLDRFMVVYIDYERRIYESIIRGYGYNKKETESLANFIEDWYKACVESSNIEFIPSYRGIANLADILRESELNLEMCMEMALFKHSVSSNTLGAITNCMKSRNKYAQFCKEYVQTLQNRGE